MDRGLAQRRVDRIATAGIALTLLAAAALLALDPVDAVRRPVALEPSLSLGIVAPAPAATAIRAPEPSPLRRYPLPGSTWQLASDGRYAAFPRVASDGSGEILVSSLGGESNPLGLPSVALAGPPTWRLAYRSGERRVLGQLSLAGGVLVFEEFATSARLASATIYALRLDGERWTLVDEYALPDAQGQRGFPTAAPVTDGRRVLWVRQTAEGSELRVLDLADRSTRALHRSPAAIAALALWRDTLAFTVLPDGAAPQSFRLDLASGEVERIEGFSAAYVQALGPRGLVLNASESPVSDYATWLVARDGTRERIGANCSVLMSARVFATRCGPQLAVQDLVTGRTLYQHSLELGVPAVFDRGAVWSDGDELVLYELPALPQDDSLRAP